MLIRMVIKVDHDGLLCGGGGARNEGVALRPDQGQRQRAGRWRVAGWVEQALGYLVSKIQDGYGNERQGTNSVVTKRWEQSRGRE